MSDAASQCMPAGLGDAGAALWDEVTEGLTLRSDESAVLAAACRTADQILVLEGLLAESEPMIPGSKGQLVLHPAVAELRLQRQLQAALLGRLDVPEVDGIGSEWDGLTASQRARRAARARWDKAS